MIPLYLLSHISRRKSFRLTGCLGGVISMRLFLYREGLIWQCLENQNSGSPRVASSVLPCPLLREVVLHICAGLAGASPAGEYILNLAALTGCFPHTREFTAGLSGLLSCVAFALALLRRCSPAGLYLASCGAGLRIGKFGGFTIKEKRPEAMRACGCCGAAGLHTSMTAS